MRSFFIVCIALFLEAGSIYFIPHEAKEAQKTLLFSIDKAKRSINIAMYSFTNHTIAKHLKNAAKRGVKISILLDYKQNVNDPYSQIGYLAKYKNIDIYTIKGLPSKKRDFNGIMHIKMAVIDHSTIVFGSANWTNSAFRYNYEVIYFTKDYTLAKKCEKELMRLVRKAKKY